MTSDLPILYSFRRCPYAMRARLALLASGTRVEIREIVLRNKPAAMLQASPKGTVPVLVLPDGRVIEQSLEIMDWALTHNDPEGWAGKRDTDLIALNDGPFKHHLDRYKYPERHGSDPIEHRQSGYEILSLLNNTLIKNDNLSGVVRGLTDAAIMPFVRQFAATDAAWFDAQPLPQLQHWLASHVASDLFVAAMVRLAPWQPGDAPVYFGADG